MALAHSPCTPPRKVRCWPLRLRDAVHASRSLATSRMSIPSKVSFCARASTCCRSPPVAACCAIESENSAEVNCGEVALCLLFDWGGGGPVDASDGDDCARRRVAAISARRSAWVLTCAREEQEIVRSVVAAESRRLFIWIPVRRQKLPVRVQSTVHKIRFTTPEATTAFLPAWQTTAPPGHPSTCRFPSPTCLLPADDGPLRPARGATRQDWLGGHRTASGSRWAASGATWLSDAVVSTRGRPLAAIWGVLVDPTSGRGNGGAPGSLKRCRCRRTPDEACRRAECGGQWPGLCSSSEMEQDSGREREDVAGKFVWRTVALPSGWLCSPTTVRLHVRCRMHRVWFVLSICAE